MTTTTITPAAALRVDYTATLLSPFHHGAGSSGNTSLLRTQDVVQPDGTTARAPFLSAASIRHALRDALAWHLADTIGIEPGTLTKTIVDLMWTGGAVTKTGAETDLAMARRVEDHLPMFGLLGYAAQSDIITGTLRASDMILVCAENAGRLPANADPTLAAQRAAAYRSEEFGTRHDQASGPIGRLIDTVDAALNPGRSTQMIWDTQVLKAGSQLVGHISLTPAATEAHRMVLGAALALWAPDGIAHLGAKTAQGFGEARIDGLGDRSGDLAAWTSHVEAHADDIMQLLRDISA